MADNKKYYYLKLKDNFFDSDEMIVLESMPDGYIYSNILLKLYLRSLKSQGRLMFNDRIPFNSAMLAQVTRHSVGDVEKAIGIFRDLNLVEVLDNGAIYMTDIQSFIGKSSTEADRKRDYRLRMDQEKQSLLPDGQMSDKCPDKTTPELDIEIDIDKDIDKEKQQNNRKPRKRVYEDTSVYKILANLLYEKINSDATNESEMTKKPNFDSWADDIRKMIEIDKRTKDQVEKMIEWCQTDGFWSGNILSAKKLREKYDTMAKQANSQYKQTNYQRQPVRQETMPDWVDNPVEEKKLSAERQAELRRQLEELEGTNEINYTSST